MPPVRRRSLLAVLLSTIGVLAVAVPGAQAGTISDAADCTRAQPLSQPFTPWLDPASYALAPDGGLENNAAGWTLSGAAAPSAGNESYRVGGASDNASLTIPSGSSAMSAPSCVGLQWPTIRFFSRSSGTGLLSSMRVDVVFDEALTGATLSVPVGTVLPGSSWRPTTQMLMVINTLGAVQKDGMVPVAFRFTPVGSGTWQLDDLYIDPWRGP